MDKVLTKSGKVLWQTEFSNLNTNLFIDGNFTPPTPANFFDVLDPSTGSLITKVADGSIGDAILAVESASNAFENWSSTSPRERSEILMRCYSLMIDRLDWFSKLISLENGKSLADARGEVRYAAEFFRWYAEEAVRSFGELGHSPSGNYRILVDHQPIGVALLVTPWNFPAAMATRKIAPALAAGCTVVLKPAAETPLTALAVAALMNEAGVPAGVVNVVTTSNASGTVSAMLHHPKVRKLSFTGSTAVGRILLKEAADQIISCSMELGGNAPVVVFDDADLEKAVEGTMIAKMRNGGEACTAANRIYVQEGIYDKFVARLTEEMSKLTLGSPFENENDLGPLITQKSSDRIQNLVDDAVSKGAKICTGGTQIESDGFFYPATVLADVKEGSKILTEEIFGPVAVVVPFKNEEDAIKLANNTEYGLVSYIFSENLSRCMRVSGRFESGMVGINRGVVSDVAAPFGGTKESGLGREGGHHGLMEYIELKYIAVNY